MTSEKELLKLYSKEAVNKQLKAYRSVKKWLTTLDNPNRKKILNIITEATKKGNKITITGISKKIDISYKSTYKNVEIMKDAGIVKLTKDPKASGQAVNVELDYPTAIMKK